MTDYDHPTAETFREVITSDYPSDVKAILLRHMALRHVIEEPEALKRLDPKADPRTLRQGYIALDLQLDTLVGLMGDELLARDKAWELRSLLSGKFRLKHEAGVLDLSLGALRDLRDLLNGALAP